MLLECGMPESYFNSLLQIEICFFLHFFFFSLRALHNLHSSKANLLAPFLVPFSEKKKKNRLKIIYRMIQNLKFN